MPPEFEYVTVFTDAASGMVPLELFPLPSSGQYPTKPALPDILELTVLSFPSPSTADIL